jgi:4-amino-4-deoxychorismate lyase
MSLLIESIKLQDGTFCNLFYHEQRMIRSLHMLFGIHEDLDLERFLNAVNFPAKGLYKCRLVYDDQSKEVEFLPYEPKPISSLMIVEHDRISYEFKYRDRKTIDRLYSLKKDCDDILIVKRGVVTDSSFSNILFRKGSQWYTPWSALLKGTQRQKLIEDNKVIPEEIYAADIRSFDSFKLINAMLEMDGPEIDVKNIVF